MSNSIIISEFTGSSVDDLPIELVERRGVGHPDSLCDGIAERISQVYVDWCLNNLGGVLHHNFDKILLIAGEVNTYFGGGELIKPIRILVGGRATRIYQDKQVPVDTIVDQATKDYLNENMRHLNPDEHCIIESLAGQGSTQLTSLVDNRVANDTTFCFSHWPRSSLEEIVYLTTEFVNNELIDSLPIGEDVKIMGYRNGTTIQLTVATPFLAKELKNSTDYLNSKAEAQNRIAKFVTSIGLGEVQINLNIGDNPDLQRFYITLTGTSAEMGDDGSVSRGNRANGLVTPFRLTGTPPAGKNPISHPGKLYNVLSIQIAKQIIQDIDDIDEVQVCLASHMGSPLDKPLVASVLVHSKKKSLNNSLRSEITGVINSVLDNCDQIREGILKAPPKLY